MTLKSIVSAAVVFALSATAVMAQSIDVTPSSAPNGDGNRVWTVEIDPSSDAGDLPSAVGVELAFSITAGDSLLSFSVVDDGAAGVDPTANNTNVAAGSSDNDTWYYKTDDGLALTGSNGIWVAIDTDDGGTPEDETDEQNAGANPFTLGITEGLYVDGANVFAALGSVEFSDPTSDVLTLQIVTDGNAGGVLEFLGGSLGQADADDPELYSVHTLAAATYYVPGDFDGSGTVTSDDFNLLLSDFGGAPSLAWDGFQPVGATVQSDEFNALLANFNSGVSTGPGAGAGIPEPGTIVLLLSAACGVFFRRVR